MGLASSKTSEFANIYNKNSTTELSVRELAKEDFEKGFPQTLAFHFKVDEKDLPNAETFAQLFADYANSTHYFNKIVVVEDLKAQNTKEAIVGTARLIIRPSLVDYNTKVAHIEELALRQTREDFNHHDIYPVLLGALTDIATQAKVYKITNYPHGGWNYYYNHGTFEAKLSHGDYLPNDDDKKRITALTVPVVVPNQTKVEEVKHQDTPKEIVHVAPTTTS